MIQSEVLQRVLRIRVGFSAGTAFTMEVNDKQYIVTAKHLFEAMTYPQSLTVEFLIDGNYKQYNVDVRYPADPNIDVAVMQINPQGYITPRFNNRNSSAGVILGQDVFFVGFPFNYDQILQNFPDTNSPLPFVKKACLSGSQNKNRFFLDGINNPGFSGGPVCFKSQGERTFSILGVVGGYRFNHATVFDDKTDKPLPMHIKENTGIIIVSDIRSAVEIAENWI